MIVAALWQMSPARSVLMTSRDGAIWTPLNVDIPFQLRGIHGPGDQAYDSYSFLAVGESQYAAYAYGGLEQWSLAPMGTPKNFRTGNAKRVEAEMRGRAQHLKKVGVTVG